MSIQTRKYKLIERVMQFNEAELRKLEVLLEEVTLDPKVERDLTARALESEKDIEEGRVFSLKEANDRLNKRLGL